MAQISLPQPDENEPDVYEFGFDKHLNRETDSGSLMDDITELRNLPGVTTFGSEDKSYSVDPNQGIWLGAVKFADAPFAVDMNGSLKATTGIFTGSISGATGTFTGTVIVGSINIPNETQANSFHVAGGATYGGDTWWGANVANGTLSANAYVLNTGEAKFKNIQIGGTTRQYTITNEGLFTFGDGSDGSGVFNGTDAVTGWTRSGTTYTADRDTYFTDATISSGVTLKPVGYRIFGQGTLTNSGTIERSGNAGGNASGTTGGTAGAAVADGYLKGGVAGKAGGSTNGQVGTAGEAVSNSLGSNGSGGGFGGNGPVSGGAGGTATASNVKLIANWHLQTLLDISSTGSTVKFTNGGGAGSGAAGADAGNGWGAGGGSGSAAGSIAIYFRIIIVNSGGIIRANGGNGGNGANSPDMVTSGGGGGGGGNGGEIILVYNSYTNSGSVTSTQGTGGTPGASGGSGGNGTAGTIRQFQISL